MWSSSSEDSAQSLAHATPVVPPSPLPSCCKKKRLEKGTLASSLALSSGCNFRPAAYPGSWHRYGRDLKEMMVFLFLHYFCVFFTFLVQLWSKMFLFAFFGASFGSMFPPMGPRSVQPRQRGRPACRQRLLLSPDHTHLFATLSGQTCLGRRAAGFGHCVRVGGGEGGGCWNDVFISTTGSPDFFLFGERVPFDLIFSSNAGVVEQKPALER